MEGRVIFGMFKIILSRDTDNSDYLYHTCKEQYRFKGR